MKYQKVDDGLFPQALSALNGLRKCADVSGMPSNSIRTNPLMLLMAAVMYVSVILVLFAPRPAEAMASYVSAVVSNNYPGSNLANLCANCHTDWAGGGPYTAWGTDYNLHTTTGGVTPPP